MATNPATNAELIEGRHGWVVLIDHARRLGSFVSEDQAASAARAAIGPSGLIDVHRRVDRDSRDGIADISDVADAELADRSAGERIGDGHVG